MLFQINAAFIISCLIYNVSYMCPAVTLLARVIAT